MQPLEIILNENTLEIDMEEISVKIMYNILVGDYKPFLISEENIGKYKKSPNGLWVLDSKVKKFKKSYSEKTPQFNAFNQIIEESKKLMSN